MSKMVLKDLFKKYLEDKLSPAEFSELYEMVTHSYNAEELDELLEGAFSTPAFSGGSRDYDRAVVFAFLKEKIEEREEIREAPPAPILPLHHRRWRTVAAAALLFLLAGGSYWYFHTPTASGPVADAKTAKFDAPPGHTGAILTLADGKQIPLDSAQNGDLAQQGGTRLLKRGQELSYQPEEKGPATILYNTITTPRGSQYVVVLPDSSKVYMNAGSSLRFPTAFSGKLRTVILTGEAYFEVARNKHQPFEVITKGQTVEVLGTQFNINAYDEEKAIKTTLLEGKVSVAIAEQQTLLAPGEQSQIGDPFIANKGIKIDRHANTEEAVAWKNGFFQFENADIQTIMRQFARWYDVEVVFKNTVPERLFSGKIHRNLTLSQALDLLSYTNVHFTIDAKKITVLSR